jgi:hypothetical protein
MGSDFPGRSVEFLPRDIEKAEASEHRMERPPNCRTAKHKSLAKAPRSQRKDGETLRNLYSSVAAAAPGSSVSIRGRALLCSSMKDRLLRGVYYKRERDPRVSSRREPGSEMI